MEAIFQTRFKTLLKYPLPSIFSQGIKNHLPPLVEVTKNKYLYIYIYLNSTQTREAGKIKQDGKQDPAVPWQHPRTQPWSQLLRAGEALGAPSQRQLRSWTILPLQNTSQSSSLKKNKIQNKILNAPFPPTILLGFIWERVPCMQQERP